MKTLLLEAKAAFLLEAGVPTRQETGKDVLYRYGEHSWSRAEEVPWNMEEKRAMTPAEGIEWLAVEKARRRP